MNKSLLSWTLLFACNLMWSLQFTCIKLVQDQVGKYFTVWGPLLLSTFCLTPFVLRQTRIKKTGWTELRIFIPLAMLGAFPAQVLMTWGTQYTLASNAAILTLALPVITAFFAFIFLKEKMNPARWVSFIIAIVGVILCSAEDIHKLDFSTHYSIGNMLIFLAILSNAFYNTGCKKISERYSAIEMVFFTYVVMIVLLTPLVFYYESEVFYNIPHFSQQTWIGLVLLTVFHNFLSMILFFVALKMLDAIQVALSNYLITFFAIPIAAIWLDESLRLWAVVGGVLVLTSTLIITVWEYQMNSMTSTVKENPIGND